MDRRFARKGRASAAVALALGVLVGGIGATTARAADAEILAQGKRVYELQCAGCHGAEGNGRGPASDMLIVKPRDFTKGLYKFRTTPNGTLPTDADLYRTITKGVNRTSMPEWSLLPERERWALVEYVKTFYPEWQKRGAGEPIQIPGPPSTLLSPESVARGRDLYEGLDCGRCHGPGGKGDGPSSKTLEPDAWGNKQVPFNFTKGALKSGGAPQDVYRTFMTGLNGTAMPSYADVFDSPDGESIKPGDAWNLVSYILSLRESGKSPAQSPPAVAPIASRPADAVAPQAKEQAP